MKIDPRSRNVGYNAYDQLTHEDLGFGLRMNYTYDKLDRLTEIEFHDKSFATYQYDPYHLKKMRRLNQTRQTLYEVDCQTYDLHGHLLKFQSLARTTSTS